MCFNKKTKAGDDNMQAKDNTSDPDKQLRCYRFGIGTYLILITILILLALFSLWPVQEHQGGKYVFEKTWFLFGYCCELSDEAGMILIVLLTGALGSIIHAATSFADFAGNRTLSSSWKWWYLLRPLIGGSLAMIFYFIIRGGLLSAGTDSSTISLYGIAGISGLVGMFSKNATDKLSEVFMTLFRTEPGKGDDARNDSITTTPPEKKP